MEKYYYPKGIAAFVMTADGVKCFHQDYPDERLPLYEKRIYGDFMSGKDFYECVDCGGFIDYDGNLGYVFVNGYESNLGLHHEGLSQGGFRVDGSTWLEMCEDYDVEVVWYNK